MKWKRHHYAICILEMTSWKIFFSPTSLLSRSFCALAKSSSLLSFRLAPPMLTFGFRLKSPSKNPFIVSLCFQTPMSLWYNLDIFDLSDDQWWVFFLLDFLEKLRKTADSMFTFRSKMRQVYNFKIILWTWRVTNKPETFENCKTNHLFVTKRVETSNFSYVYVTIQYTDSCLGYLD